MRAPSDANPANPQITFRILSEDKMKTLHSKSLVTIAQIVRWSVVGIFTLIIALPTIVSITTSA
jgi:hypothetical protein